MRAAWKAGFRIAGLLAITTLIAHCGDSSVHIRTGSGVNPSAGTFQGTTDDGSPIVIVVDSIRSIAFTCDGDPIAQTFNPAKSVNSDGTFSVTFTDGGRDFHVSGTFTDQNHVEGDIDDQDNHCDGSFSASRTGAVVTATPPGGRTATPQVTPTGIIATPTTVTSGGETATPPGGETPTGGVATPTPASTSSGDLCPNKVTLEGEGEEADLDTGWTGIAQNQVVIGKGSLTVALDCGGRSNGSCGSCAVSGPITSTTVVNNRRCSTDTAIQCDANGTPASACPNGGSCVFVFGAPLPLSSGGVPVCVTNKVNGTITGTANPDTGSGESTAALTSSVFSGLTVDQPCPICSGASFNTTGTCSDGQHAGQPCTVHGTSVLFGNTSLDCGPNPGGNIGNLSIQLDPSTGTRTLAPSNTCTSIPFTGKACYCSGQKQANACDDGVCTDPNGTGGTCEAGPFDQFCSIEKFRGCLTDVDCPTGAGNCQGAPVIRPCTGQTNASFAITNSVTRTGAASKTAPVIVSTFCVAATSSSAVNSAGGLPGPGALTLPSKACYTDTCTF